MKVRSLEELAAKVQEFRDARDWKQFHTCKDMLLALFLEVSELVELQQWKSESELQAAIEVDNEKFADELSDVLYWVLLLAADLKIDLEAAFLKKLKKNEEKYPVDVVKGKSHKYTHYEKENL